jgi:hypothetical protein
LRAAYLEAPNWQKFWLSADTAAEKEWPKDTLHASDVGGCPRAAMYRLLGTPEKPRSASSKANRTVMFWAGYHFHYLTYSALNWAGLLLSHERSLEMPEGWSGALDAEILTAPGSDPLVFDEKTVLPNALNYSYDMPKLPNCLQLATYGSVVGNMSGLIEYTDRAGSNTPKECEIDLSRYVYEVGVQMAHLEMCRYNLPGLPPTLDQEYVGRYTRIGPDMVLKTVGLATPWSCGYCDYHLTKKEQRQNPASGRMKKYGWTSEDSTCKPVNVPEIEVAVFDQYGLLSSCKSDHNEGVLAFIEGHQSKVYAPEEES